MIQTNSVSRKKLITWLLLTTGVISLCFLYIITFNTKNYSLSTKTEIITIGDFSKAEGLAETEVPYGHHLSGTAVLAAEELEKNTLLNSYETAFPVEKETISEIIEATEKTELSVHPSTIEKPAIFKESAIMEEYAIFDRENTYAKADISETAVSPENVAFVDTEKQVHVHSENQALANSENAALVNSEIAIASAVETLPIEEGLAKTAPSENAKIGVESFTNEENFVFIGSHIDIDSTRSESLTPPGIDLKKVLSNIIYPISMKKRNIEAKFTAQIFVDEDGGLTVSFPENVQKPFIQALNSAFKGVNIEPAHLNGNPISSTFRIPINFVLQ